ncbi:unnamed protein product, partial [Iphiclides podalirius]
MSQHGYPERLSNRSKSFQEDGSKWKVFPYPSSIWCITSVSWLMGLLFVSMVWLQERASASCWRSVADPSQLGALHPQIDHPPTGRRWSGPRGWSAAGGCSSGAGGVGAVGGGAGGGGGGAGGAAEGAGSGCKVTVLVFREGKRVNMLRVRENRDGTYSPLDQAKCPATLTQLLERESGGPLHENAVTMGKMMELRRRMEALELQRRRRPNASAAAPLGDKADIQKTRSEETLSVSSLLDEPASRSYDPYVEDDSGHYDRYDRYERYGCYGRADTCALLPPIGTRALSNHSLQDTVMESDRFKLPDALAAPDEGETPATSATPATTTAYGALVGGEGRGWRARGFGSSSQLGGAAGAGPGAGGGGRGRGRRRRRGRRQAPAGRPRAAALRLHLGPGAAHAQQVTSSSFKVPHRPLSMNRATGDKLAFHSAIKLRPGIPLMLPALSRHRNREHLHLSDERLELARHDVAEAGATVATSVPATGAAPTPATGAARRVRCGVCRRRLSAATEHRCRCGAAYCAPHRYAEVHGCAYDYKALRTHRN